MADRSALQHEYAYEIEFDDGTDFSHFYYANLVDADNPSFLRFDPLYELGHDIDTAITERTVMIPYIRVVKVLKKKEPE